MHRRPMHSRTDWTNIGRIWAHESFGYQAHQPQVQVSKYVAIMAEVGTDTALHIPPVGVSTALMAAEGEAFPVTMYR